MYSPPGTPQLRQTDERNFCLTIQKANSKIKVAMLGWIDSARWTRQLPSGYRSVWFLTLSPIQHIQKHKHINSIAQLYIFNMPLQFSPKRSLKMPCTTKMQNQSKMEWERHTPKGTKNVKDRPFWAEITKLTRYPEIGTRKNRLYLLKIIKYR